LAVFLHQKNKNAHKKAPKKNKPREIDAEQEKA